MLAIDAPTEAVLAEALGFKPAAFSNRKKRSALPTEEIDELIRQHGLRHEWVYAGDLPMFTAGEKADLLEQEFREVIDQIRASALHNATLETIRPLIKGIVWRDRDVIEEWIKDVSHLNQDERFIVSAYRRGDPDLKAALLLLAQSGSSKTSRVTQSFHGDVGQVIQGSQKFEGGLSIRLGKSKNKKSS